MPEPYSPTRKVRRPLATIPQPHENLASLHVSALATKEAVETLQGLRGDREEQAVIWGEMPPIPPPYVPPVSVADTAWKPVPYVNGWADYGLPYSPCGYRKLSSGLVIMKGLTLGGSAQLICTLPVGYRPGITMLYTTFTSPNSPCRMDVAPDGSVNHVGGNSGWISLCSIYFFAEN